MHPILALHALVRLHSPVVLCLHSVGDGIDALPEAAFRGLLDLLDERRYRFLTADDVTGAQVLRPKTVLLTFDDGRLDNRTVVAPILREYGIPATFYVCPELIGQRWACPSGPDADDAASSRFVFDLMTWEQLGELRDAGMTIGCHSATHANLARCSADRLEREIAGAKRMIEERLAIDVRHFCYPWGRFDKRVLAAVRAAGYRTAAAVSVNPPLPPRPWSEFMLPRLVISPAAGDAEFERALSLGNLVHRAASQTRRAAEAFVEGRAR